MHVLTLLLAVTCVEEVFSSPYPSTLASHGRTRSGQQQLLSSSDPCSRDREESLLRGQDGVANLAQAAFGASRAAEPGPRVGRAHDCAERHEERMAVTAISTKRMGADARVSSKPSRSRAVRKRSVSRNRSRLLKRTKPPSSLTAEAQTLVKKTSREVIDRLHKGNHRPNWCEIICCVVSISLFFPDPCRPSAQ